MVGIDLPGRDVVLFGDGVNGDDLRTEVGAFDTDPKLREFLLRLGAD